LLVEGAKKYLTQYFLKNILYIFLCLVRQKMIVKLKIFSI